MKREISILAALILAGDLLLSAGYSSIGPGNSAVYAASEFSMATSPTAGEVNVNVSSSIKLKFDRQVYPQSGDITLTTRDTGTPYVTVPIGSSGLISNSTEYEVKLGKQLEKNKTYTVTVPRGLFKDGAGADSAAASWTFTSSPEMNLNIVASEFTPANYSRVDSTTLTQLSFKLNKKLQKSGGSIKLISSADNSVVQEFKVNDGDYSVNLQSDDSSTIVRLNLASRLTAGKSYYVLIDPYAFKDDENKTFAGITSGNIWSFSTKGTGVAVNVSPASGATAVSPAGNIQLNFDQPMTPVNGVIKLSSTNAADTRYFDVNSSAVTGGGTRTITVASTSATSPLMNNTIYTVTIPAGAFNDQDGNAFPASGTPYVWSFTTTSQTGYAVDSLSPADRSESAALDQPIKITFNRPSKYIETNPVSLYKSNGTKLGSKVIGGNNDSEFVIVPSSALENDTIYYVDIPSGAFIEKNNPNSYEGLNGKNSWSFRTVALDKRAPVLVSTQLESNRTIRLKYDEAIRPAVALLSSSFNVTVNDEKRAVESVYIQGDSVYVTLSTGVAVGQFVKIAYTGGLRTIQDAAGNAASTFSLRQVTNTVQTALPAPKDGILSGKTLTLNFNDTLKAISNNAFSQFSVYADGVSLGVVSSTSSGSTVILGLSNDAANGQTIRVTYYAGSYPIQDQYSQNIANFSDFYIRNTSDSTAPVYQSAAGSGNKIVLTYNEGLSTANLPMNSQFSVLVGNTPNYVTNVDVSGNLVTLTLASALSTNNSTTISYVPGTSGISDLNGNRAAYINLQPVSVSGTSSSNGTTTVPFINSATVSGDELIVNFSKNMQASSSLYTNQFGVRADGSSVGIQSYTVSGSTLKLLLSTAVKTGQTVVLSYMSGSGNILDLNGSALASFSALSVQNLTGVGTSATGRPSYLGTLAASEFGKEYPLLKGDSAASADDRSVYNQSVKRYTLTADRLTASYDYLNKMGSPSLAFEVPSTELGAYVVVPLKPLLEAVKRDSKAAFAIRYGDSLYNLALNDIDMTGLASKLTTDSSNISLMLRLEKVPFGTFGPVEATLKAQGLQSVTSLVDIRLTAAVSGNYSNSTVLSVPGEYTARTTSSLVSDQTLAARLDLVYSEAAYLPGKISGAGSYTFIQAKVVGNQVVGTFLSTRGFSDMSRHWSKSSVALLAAKNIIDNSYGSTFKPEQKITRAEFAVMLSRGLGLLGDRETAQRFSDVQASTQIGDAIGAAAKAGIITGNTDGTFRPNANITREHMATMMIRAMEYTKNPITLSGTSTSVLSAFKDKSKVSGQSAEFVAKAVQEGIILGMPGAQFQPQGNATRSQAAVMLQRMLTKAGFL
ncbi:Ig-like domain-containing protein [Paenibacillus sp. FSL L8-0340]|uniref:Ig-like domain-containing protein n=1 Tax=Paenibacillus sp. FSL L8-0340 TaxID=2954685 RepID=UPI0031593511